MKRDLVLIGSYIVMFLAVIIIGILVYDELTMAIYENPETTAVFMISTVIGCWVYGLIRMFITFYQRYNREQ